VLAMTRYVPAVVAYLAVLTIQYTDRTSPVLPEFAASSGALLVVSCWLTIALLDVEDPAQHLVTLSHARGWRPVLAGAVVAVLVCAVVMTAVSEIWSVIEHRHALASEIGVGALAHLAGALLGIAIGLPCCGCWCRAWARR
jgi:membrane associated rhomboid family serine protease